MKKIMIKQQTREQLLIENTTLKQEIESLNKQIEVRNTNQRLLRKEFSKAFNWIEQDHYSRMKEPSDVSWEQIFVEIGRLLNTATRNADRERIYQLEKENVELGQRLEEISELDN